MLELCNFNKLENTMSTSIHGHDVMHLMLELGGPFTRESLKEAIDARFGTDARFHTCSAEGLDAAGLIAYSHAWRSLNNIHADHVITSMPITQ